MIITQQIWYDEKKRIMRNPLQENIITDVLVVGGGMAGILCAYMLKRAGVDCVLIEAGRLCGGTTAKTTAKVTFQHGLIYERLIESIGKEKAGMYLDIQKKACEQYSVLSREIRCDWENKASYVYSLSDRRKLEEETAALNSLGVGACFCEEVDLPIKTAGAVMVKDQAQINPLKLAFGLAEGLTVYENTPLRILGHNKAITDRAEIRYRAVVIATHFPLINKHGAYFLKMYQHRSYVLALDGCKLPDGMYVDENEKGLSFRNYGSVLLLGGGSHRTGKPGGSYQELEEFAHIHYPTADLIGKWATQDCMTLDKMPYVGRYSKSTRNMYVATGFNKWGMSSSMVSAMLLSELILGKQSDYASLLSPSRSMLHPQLAVNAVESAINLLTPTVPRCPHLGCALKYNRAEHSWDCPCHGSRFTSSGKLIEGPSMHSLKSKKADTHS